METIQDVDLGLDYGFAQASKAALGILDASTEQKLFSICREYLRDIVPNAELAVYLWDERKKVLSRSDNFSNTLLPATIPATSEFVRHNGVDRAADQSFDYRNIEKLEDTLQLPQEFQGLGWFVKIVPPNYRLVFLAAVPDGTEGDFLFHIQQACLISNALVVQLRHIWDIRNQSILSFLASLDSGERSRSHFFNDLALEFANILQAEGCTILLRCRDTQEKQLGVVGTTGLFCPSKGADKLSPQEIAAIRYAEGEGLTGTILQTGQPVRLDHVSEEQLAKAKSAESPFMEGSPRPFLGFPLTQRGEVVAVVRLHAKRNSAEGLTAYSAADEVALMELAQLLVPVLDQYGTSLDRKELNNHRSLLLESTEMLHQSANVRDVFDVIVKSARQVSGADVAYFLTQDQDSGKFVARAHDFEKASKEVGDYPSSFTVPNGEGLIGDAVRSGKPVLVRDVTKNNNFLLPEELQSLPFDIRSEACIPIMGNGECLGVLDVMSSYPFCFYPNCLEEPTLVALARHGAIAILSDHHRVDNEVLNKELAEAIERDGTRQVGKSFAHLIKSQFIGWIWDSIHGLRELEHTHPDLKARLDKINGELKKKKKMFDEFLVQAEIEPIHIKKIAPLSVLKNVWKSFRRLKSLNKSLIFTPDPGTNFGSIYADPISLMHICYILLDNACYWAKSYISIGLEDNGNRYSLIVTDDGPGISAKHLPKVKDHTKLFSNRQPSGSGWGLNLVNVLAKSHGGQWTYSREGDRSTFRVELLKEPNKKNDSHD